MQIHYFKTEEELASKLELMFRTMLEKKVQNLRGFLPTGKSALGFYRQLISHQEYWQQKLQVIQIDEFISQDRFFYQSLKENILTPLHLEAMAEAIDPTWSAAEFQRHLQKTLSPPIDFAVLGLGPNGHIGFHEPHLNHATFLGGQVTLSEESFARVKSAPCKLAYTFGSEAFLQAKKIFLVVIGQEKEKIFQDFLQSQPSAKLPVSLLSKHNDLTVLTTLQNRSEST